MAMAAKAKELKATGKTVYDFSLGEPDATTPQHICQAALEAIGLTARVVSGGSTPSAFHSHLMQPRLTEIRPGTYLFNDRNTVAFGAATHDDCALTVLTTVVSLSGRNHAVLDAGSKSLSSDPYRGGEGSFGSLLDCSEAVLTRLSEEHGELDTTSLDEPVAIGQKVRVVPNHCCTCVNMHRRMHLCDGDEVIDVICVAARDRLH